MRSAAGVSAATRSRRSSPATSAAAPATSRSSRRSRTSSVREFDVVVAGAGHNSLVAAAYLAKAGLEVCVLEARPIIGGDTCSEELNLPGFVHDTCSTFQPTLMGSPVLRDDELGLLADYGLELIRPEVGCAMPFADGPTLVQHLDPQRTWESIAAVNRKDADAYLRLLEEWDRVKGAFGKASNT